MQTVNIRSEYSFKKAYGNLQQIHDRLKEVDYRWWPVAEVSYAHNWWKITKRLKDDELGMTLGCELLVHETLSKGRKGPPAHGWVVYPQDTIRGLNSLIELSTTPERFYYNPRLCVDDIINHEFPLFVVLDEFVTESIIDKINKVKDSTPHVFMFGVSPATSYMQHSIQLGHCKAHDWDMVARSANLYCLPEHRPVYEVLAGKYYDRNSWPGHILDKDEWEHHVHRHTLKQDFEEIHENTTQLMESVQHIRQKQMQLVPPPHNRPLIDMALEGAKAKNVDLNDEYMARLNREISIVEKQGFSDYFRIVADIVAWAKQHMVVGPARGSACGSLLCWLIDITSIDPIPHGLIFERFIDENRNDMPDIDIDFSDSRRYMVFDRLVEIYGAGKVSKLSNVGTFKPRSALFEAGKVLDIPAGVTDAVLDSMIERSSGDARAQHTLQDTLDTLPAGQELARQFPEITYASSLEGHLRNPGTHASAIVLAKEDLLETAPIDRRSGCLMMDKYDAEEIGLLKIDVLGLTQLSILEDCMEMVGLPLSFLDEIPLEIQECFDIINKRRFAGVFQFNGDAIQNLLNNTGIREFIDYAHLIAAARPGPLASGLTSKWMLRRNDPSKIETWHPIFEPYVEDTLGVILYQEQVMTIGRNIGDLSWIEVTALRKAMSKSLGIEYFDQFGDPWKKAAIEKGVDPQLVDEIWNNMCSYGSFAFNKSHCVAYGYITHWCCYLKWKYPLEFAAASLNHENDSDRTLHLLRDVEAEGYGVVPFDKDRSTLEWRVDKENKDIIGPVTAVKGIGPAMAKKFMIIRERKEDFPPGLAKKLKNPETGISTLWPVRDGIKEILPDPKRRNILSRIYTVQEVMSLKSRETFETSIYPVVVCATLVGINIRDLNEAVFVARRDGKLIDDGTPTNLLNLRLKDDTGLMIGRVTRWKYKKVGEPIVARGGRGRVLYAFKGSFLAFREGIRMMIINRAKYLGDLGVEVSGSAGRQFQRK